MNIELELNKIGLSAETYNAFLEDCSDKIDKLSDMEWGEIIEKYNLPISVDMLRKAQGTTPFGGAFVRQFLLEQAKTQYCQDSCEKDENVDDGNERTDTYDYYSQLVQKEQDIYIAKRKLQDQRTELNKVLRNQARLEENERLILTQLSEIAEKRYPFHTMVTTLPSTQAMVVCLSDLHLGAAWDTVGGMFNIDIAKQRLGKYLNEVKNIRKTHGINRCVVCILGDCVSGNIHKTIAITNRENVVEQTKIACELVTDFIYELSEVFASVEVHSVAGNHSRIETKKEDALLAERLDNMIPWFAKHMLKHVSNVNIVLDEPDETISRFTIYENVYYMVHGEFDGMNASAIESLCSYMGEFPDVVLMGHKHFPAMTTVSGTRVVQCGSLCGSGDEFTRKNRLFGDPSQTVLVCDARGIVSMYPINLSEF